MKRRPGLAALLVLGSGGVSAARAADPAPGEPQVSSALVQQETFAYGLGASNSIGTPMSASSISDCVNAAGSVMQQNGKSSALCLDKHDLPVARVTCGWNEGGYGGFVCDWKREVPRFRVLNNGNLSEPR
jgi:hypothetical protein